jgi:hypothetical protein
VVLFPFFLIDVLAGGKSWLNQEVGHVTPAMTGQAFFQTVRNEL